MTVPVGEIAPEAKRLLEVTRSRWNWRSRRCGRATGCSTSAGRSSSTWCRTAFRWCASLSGTASGRSCTRSRRFRITWTGKNENPRLKEGMVLAIEPMVNAGRPESQGAGGPLDGGDQGRLLLGPLRALRGGDRERAVGADAAVNRQRKSAKRPAGSGGDGGRAAAQRDVPGGVGERRAGAGPRGRRGGKEFCPAPAGRPGGGGAFARTTRTRGRIVKVAEARAVRQSERYESPGFSQKDLRQVQGDPPPRRGAGDLREPQAQAAAGYSEGRKRLWHVLQAWICRPRSGPKSG